MTFLNTVLSPGFRISADLRIAGLWFLFVCAPGHSLSQDADSAAIIPLVPVITASGQTGTGVVVVDENLVVFLYQNAAVALSRTTFMVSGVDSASVTVTFASDSVIEGLASDDVLGLRVGLGDRYLSSRMKSVGGDLPVSYQADIPPGRPLLLEATYWVPSEPGRFADEPSVDSMRMSPGERMLRILIPEEMRASVDRKNVTCSVVLREGLSPDSLSFRAAPPDYFLSDSVLVWTGESVSPVFEDGITLTYRTVGSAETPLRSLADIERFVNERGFALVREFAITQSEEPVDPDDR